MDAATAQADVAMAPVRALVAGLVESITDLGQFEDALIALCARLESESMPAPAWAELLEKTMLAARLIGREAIREQGIGVRGQGSGSREQKRTLQLAERFDPLPFDEAIEAARDRMVLPRFIFDTLQAEAKSRAFTIAWQDSARVLMAAHQAHLDTLQTGGTLREFRLRLPEMWEQEGWAGDRPWHADLVFRQQSQMAYMAGRFEQMADTGITHWKYSALLDGRVRPTHAALDGKVFEMRDRRFYPPWEFNCRCVAEPVFDDELEGETVERSQDLSGRQFAATPDGEMLRFPEPPTAPNAFAWDAAAFSRVEPLDLSSVPAKIAAAFRRLLSASSIRTTELAESAKVRQCDSEKGMTMKTRELVLFGDTDLAEAPSRFLLVPWGTVDTRKGTYVLDDIAAREIVAEFRRGGVDLVIDRDHQSLGGKYASPDGSAPAMGWIKDLEVVKGEGIYALADWTAQGRELLAQRSYRYHSPVLEQREADLRATRIRCVALTNMPATLGTRPLVNTDDVPASGASKDANGGKDKKGQQMKDVAKLLALKDDASERDVLSAVQALSERADAAQKTLSLVCSELGVPADQPAEKIAAAVLKLKGTEETVKALSEEVKGLRETVAGNQADALIAAAEKEGKLTEAKRPWARKLLLSDRAAFEDWSKNAPVVRPQGRTEAPADTGAKGGDRKSLALSARDEFRREPGLRAIVSSERAHVNGSLLAAGLVALSDDEAKELALVG